MVRENTNIFSPAMSCSQLSNERLGIDKFIERTTRAFSLQLAEQRDITSLQNWVDARGCLARDETAYLSREDELVSLAPLADSAIQQLEAWVEDRLIQYGYWRGCRNVRKAFARYRTEH